MSADSRHRRILLHAPARLFHPFCDLKNHKVHDVVLGRSQASLEGYLARLEGKHRVKVVCMDLAAHYRVLVRQHFPNARIVADRFHVIRTVNQYFLACWKQLDPAASKTADCSPS
jgi:transposase